MTKLEMENLAQRQLEAYNQRDLKAFCDCYHPEVHVMNLISNEVHCTNKIQLEASYQELFSSSPKLHCELKSRIVLDTTIIDEEWVSGSSRYPKGVHAVAIYGFRDGLIDRVWFPR